MDAPQESERPIMSRKPSAYARTPEGMRLSRNSVGPATNTKRTMPRVSTMLVFERYRMPRDTPETAETTNATVSTAMIPISRALVTSPAPVTIWMPWPIWIAARPRVAAVPNTVATIANMSTIRPARPPVWRAPNRDRNTEEISVTRPRR